MRLSQIRYLLIVAAVLVAPSTSTAADARDSGLVYLHNRYYDPALGRFITPDPANPGGNIGLNRYAYANGSPATETDRTGLDPLMDQVMALLGPGGDIPASAKSMITSAKHIVENGKPSWHVINNPNVMGQQFKDLSRVVE